MSATARPEFLISVEVRSHLLNARLKVQLGKIPGQSEASPDFVESPELKTTEIVFAADMRPGALSELAAGVEEWFRAHPQLRPPLCERDQRYMSQAGNCYVCESCGDVVLGEGPSEVPGSRQDHINQGQFSSAVTRINVTKIPGEFVLLKLFGGEEADHARFIQIVLGIDGVDEKIEREMPGDFMFDPNADACYSLVAAPGHSVSEVVSNITAFATEHHIEVERS